MYSPTMARTSYANVTQLLTIGAIPTLAKMATQEKDRDARKSAITALSQAARNFQPGLDAVVENMPPPFKPDQNLDASDMDSVDSLIKRLREHV